MSKTQNNPVFQYDVEVINYLKERDPALGKHIDRLGLLTMKLNPDLFESLIESIISQQISGKAAITVTGRLKELLGGKCTPEGIIALGTEAIQKCGTSFRKVSYIIAAAEAAIDGRLPLDNLPKMEDEELIKCLDALPGIGRWTAEMLLLFSLNRQNVFSYDDLTIRRGLMFVHGLESISKKEFEVYRELYSPYCSVASLYLWHVLYE